MQNLINELKTNKNPERAMAMAAYMKNRFPFLGIAAPERKTILAKHQKEILGCLPTEFYASLDELFAQTEREFFYCGIELYLKFLKKNAEKSDFHRIKKRIIQANWWDGVDTLAAGHLGLYLQKFPEETSAVWNDFMQSENHWLQRSCLLFQLKYKENTDTELLFTTCQILKANKEFFIQKAIGWALRQYAKTNPKPVIDFVEKEELKGLSRREALKHFPELI